MGRVSRLVRLGMVRCRVPMAIEKDARSGRIAGVDCCTSSIFSTADGNWAVSELSASRYSWYSSLAAAGGAIRGGTTALAIDVGVDCFGGTEFFATSIVLGVGDAGFTAVGCASRATPPRSPSRPSPAARAIEVREGLASYYADQFDGRTTASGTVFDNDALVAAHPSYPFGSVVRVTNLRNRRSIDVNIVDRGPAAAIRARGVIIDLSRAAARQLGFITDGRTRVRVEVLKWGGS